MAAAANFWKQGDALSREDRRLKFNKTHDVLDASCQRPISHPLQRNIELMKELGFVKDLYRCEKYSDLGLIDTAA